MNIAEKHPPLLTIAIPTYNRSQYLDLCLSRITAEIACLAEYQRGWVKVFVSDNASIDDTPSVVSHYKEINGECFDTLRNSDNMGMDFNFTQCYESAKTPYVWLIGDDDVLLPGELMNVLDILFNNEVDLLYVNSYWFKGAYSNKLKKSKPPSITLYRSSLEFARQTNVMLTFLSGLIVRSGVGIKYRDELTSSYLVQLSWVLPLLRDGQYFMVLENDVIAAKGGNSGGYELVKVFGNNLKKITDTILKDKPKVAQAIQNGTILRFFPGLIISFRNGASKFSDKDMALGLRKIFGDNWRYYVFIAPLINMPLFFSRIYYYFVRAFVKFFGSVII